MPLEDVVQREFTDSILRAINADNLIATRQLLYSVQQKATTTDTKQIVEIVAESYILELRDGTQPNEVDIVDIAIWIKAKGLEGILQPHAVQASIRENGTTWNRQGGSYALKLVLNEDNVKRVLDIAVKEETEKILTTKWLLR